MRAPLSELKGQMAAQMPSCFQPQQLVPPEAPDPAARPAAQCDGRHRSCHWPHGLGGGRPGAGDTITRVARSCGMLLNAYHPVSSNRLE